MYAKLRRLGYFVGEADRLYRQLLHDELRMYKLYDFETFEEENPVLVEVKDEEKEKKGPAAEGEQTKLIDEVKAEVLEKTGEEQMQMAVDYTRAATRALQDLKKTSAAETEK